MILGICLSFSDQLLLQDVNDITVLRMQHREHTHLFRFLQHLEDCRIVAIERRSLIRHEELNRGNARLYKGWRLLKNPFMRVHDHGMKTEIHD